MSSNSRKLPGNMAAAAGNEPGDVLNDIDNMLQDLTDELDAMLESEELQC